MSTTPSSAPAAPVTVAPDLKTPSTDSSSPTTETKSTGPKTGSSLLKDFQEWKAKEEAKASKAPVLTSVPDLPSKTSEVKDIKDPLSETSTESKLPESIKIGEKEYKIPELEKMTKEYEQTTLKVQQYEKQISQTKANLERLFTDLQTDHTALDKLQIPQNILEQYYYEKYVEPSIPLTPEQKAERYDKSLAEKREQERQAREAADREYQEQENQKLVNHHKERWANEINQMIESSGLPKSKFVYQRAADYIKQALASKNYQVSSQDIMSRVQSDVQDLHNEQLKSMSAEQLEKILGEEGIKKLREQEMKRMSDSKFQNLNPSNPGEVRKPDQQKKRKTSVYDLL